MPAPKNLIHESSTTTGTGNFTLAAINGKIRFSDGTYGFSTGGTDVFDYFIQNRAAAEWEIGTGHMSDANTLVRDTVVLSSNSNAAVDFSVGTKDVTNDVPAAQVLYASLLASTSNGEGASLVGIEDSDGNFNATDVEAALAELLDGSFSPTFAGLTSTGVVLATSTIPQYRLLETDAAADNGLWINRANGEALLFEAFNDAVSASSTWLKVDRTGTTIDSINLQATSVQANGDEILVDTDIGSTVQGFDADTLKADVGDTLTAGFLTDSFSGGEQSSGTYTPAPATGQENFQHIVNGGAFTLAPPANPCNVVLEITNNASAGTITTSGFTQVTGDSFTTDNGDDFLCFITKSQNFSHLNVVALQ